MKNVYTPSFKPISPDAKALVAKLAEDLDMRKTVLKNADPDELQAVLASFLVFGKHDFDFVVNDLPKKQRPLCKAVFDSLLGTYLKRVSGKNTVRFENTTNHHKLKFQTVEEVQGIRVETKTGAVCLDQSYENFDIELLGHVRHSPVELVTIHSPWHHLSILEGLKESPSRRWYQLEELEQPFATPEKSWDSVKEFLVENVRLRGGYILPYGGNQFLCIDASMAIKQIDVALLRLTGKRFMFLATARNRYGREYVRPGGWA